jgi:hypothetical protein
MLELGHIGKLRKASRLHCLLSTWWLETFTYAHTTAEESRNRIKKKKKKKSYLICKNSQFLNFNNLIE